MLQALGFLRELGQTITFSQLLIVHTLDGLLLIAAQHVQGLHLAHGFQAGLAPFAAAHAAKRPAACRAPPT
jgi:hypothetical protein